MSISVTIINRINSNKLKTSSANFFPPFLFSIFADVYLGMKAALNVPSANNLLNVFGILKATKKASAKIEAPRKIAIKISLT